MTAPDVPRIGRLLDLVSLLVFLSGAALYGWSWLGMRRLRSAQPVSEDPTQFAAMARFNDLWELSRTGLGLMAAGAAVALTAMVVAWIVDRRAEDSRARREVRPRRED